ncbi:hypothetical protein EVAR_95495_1 [Eumeta japonica]|uniref:Uncharacterized protein n=1 Tax=Eumeta variegata TaxID=151549 RepID=A0A4C1UKA3_EUMVA|nr:hypothetical protein EVAR_95495_1 [Eumeta japonica]
MKQRKVNLDDVPLVLYHYMRAQLREIGLSNFCLRPRSHEYRINSVVLYIDRSRLLNFGPCPAFDSDLGRTFDSNSIPTLVLNPIPFFLNFTSESATRISSGSNEADANSGFSVSPHLEFFRVPWAPTGVGVWVGTPAPSGTRKHRRGADCGATACDRIRRSLRMRPGSVLVSGLPAGNGLV